MLKRTDMRGLSAILARCLLGLAVLIIVRASFEIIHFLGFYPERTLAALFTKQAKPPADNTLEWLIAALLAFVIWVIFDYIFYRAPNRHPLVIDYLNEANLDHVQCILKKSTSIIATGKLITKDITYHEFFVGIENRGKTTISNARLVATALNFPPQALDLAFKPKNSNSDRIDIQPHSSELFLVLSGYDTNDVGMFSPSWVSVDEFQRICRELDEPQNKHTGANLVGWQGSGIRFLKNDCYVIDICVFADDVTPINAIAVVNAKEKLELFIYKTRFRLKLLNSVGKTLDYLKIGRLGRYKWPITPKFVRKKL